VRRITPDNWVALGLAMGLVIAATLLVYVPQGRRLQTIRAQVASQKMALSVNAEKAVVIPAMVKHIEATKRRYKGFERRMPKRKELAGFLSEITHILETERLSNQLTEPGSPTREQLFHTLPIIMKFQGQYLSLASLLGRIDEMDRLTRVQKLVISQDPRSDQLNIELQMNIYFTES